ncbi:hypothetical protein HDV00_004367 [Rhizophlyctis rosea]|nr:hypothetical protein HDV00_004367 [Rhizophlyctis rosea]
MDNVHLLSKNASNTNNVTSTPSPLQNPPLPLELIQHIAELAHPATTQKLRAACKPFRVFITLHDLHWAKAGWRHFHRGLQNSWDWAVQHWHTKIIDVYLTDATEHSAENRRSVVLHAADRGDDVMVGKLLAQVEFAAPATRELVLREALFLAVHGNHPTAVKSLLQAGATDARLRQLAFTPHQGEPLRFSEYGRGSYALEFAYKNADVTALLLEATTYTQLVLSSSMLCAVAYWCGDVVEILLKVGANIHQSKGAALAMAAINGDADLTKKLLELGADVNMGWCGNTLLRYLRRWTRPSLKSESERRAYQRTWEFVGRSWGSAIAATVQCSYI